MTCPFCGDPGAERFCGRCGRDPTAARRVCPACSRLSPQAEPRCCHCQRAFRSELLWKVPLILVLLVLVVLVQAVLQSIH